VTFEATDQALVRLARERTKEGLAAYQELVQRHQGGALRLGAYLLGNRIDAEDVAQEAFVRAYMSLPRADESTNFGAWLRTIVTRLCFNLRRDQRARSRREQAEEGSTRLPVSTRTAVEWTLQQLPYPYREILVLRFVEGLAIEEIATTLDLGLSAAKMRLGRARERFFEVYRREHKTPPSLPIAPAAPNL
jgi:RNA polymerase sigma-70 factor, ECF subfamily